MSAFPSTSILDNFNRANNSTLGANWTVVFSNLSIASNRAAGTSTENGDYYNAASYGPDVETYITLTTLPGNNNFIDLWARVDLANSNLYLLEYEQLSGTDTVRFYRVDGGSAVQIGATMNQNFNAGDSLGLRIVGNVLSAYYKPSGGNWTALGNVTDNTYNTAGYIGLWMTGTTGRLDDFGGGNVTASPIATATQTPSPTQTASTTPTQTASPTQTFTVTSTATQTSTPTTTHTATASAVPSQTATATASSTPSQTASPTASPTPSQTASPTPSQTASSTPAQPPTATPAPPFYPVQNWLFTSSAEGWTGPQHISGFTWQSGGSVGGDIAGNDPIILSPYNLNLDITSNKVVKVRIRNSTSGSMGQLFFITSADQGWDEPKSKQFYMQPNSDYIEYTLDMSDVTGWQGNLLQLRFDPAGSSGSFSIDSIQVGSAAPPPPPPDSVTINASFVYDGDGNRVAQTLNGVTTYFVGSYYEVTAGVATKYYYAGSQRIAMRKNGTLYYMFSDHLGSTSVTTDSAGNVVSELRYKPWGETRYAGGNTSTRYQYTGQFSYESDFGFYFYQSRFYDPSIGRFTSPDTIIPLGQGVQAWDRFAYTSNNPVRYNDPSGHCPICLTAVIGAAVGGIVGAVGYTAYIAATGEEFNSTHFWGATGGGAVAGALIGSGIAFIGGAAAATAFAEGAAGAVANAAISVGVDGIVTEQLVGEDYTVGDAAITATTSFATSGLSSVVNMGIDQVIKQPIDQALAKLGAAAVYTPVINSASRTAKGQQTTLMDLTMDATAGIINRGVIDGLGGPYGVNHNTLNIAGNAAQFPFTTLVPLKKKFGWGDRMLEDVVIIE